MKRKSDDALAIIDRRFFRSERAKRELEEARAGCEVARLLYELRNRAGLTQRQLAERVGTSHSVISRLEADDYQGHSLGMLRRIAAALGKRLEIRFIDDKDARRA